MKVSPGEVHHLYNQGLSMSEIARRLKISRALVNLKLREYYLDIRTTELEEKEAELEAREVKVEARENEINKIPGLEERAHFLESQVHSLNSKRDSLTKECNELNEAIRNKKEVIEESKEREGRIEEEKNKHSALKKTIVDGKTLLSNISDLRKRSTQILEETKRQINIENLRLYRLKEELDKIKKEKVRLSDEITGLSNEKKHLEDENRVKKEAINEIEESFYGFIELTKQISLYMPGESATKTKNHEEIRKKVLQGMEIIAEKANIAKPDL